MNLFGREAAELQAKPRALLVFMAVGGCVRRRLQVSQEEELEMSCFCAVVRPSHSFPFLPKALGGGKGSGKRRNEQQNLWSPWYFAGKR